MEKYDSKVKEIIKLNDAYLKQQKESLRLYTVPKPKPTQKK